VAQEQLEQSGTGEEQDEKQENGSEPGNGHGGLKTAAAASVAAGVSYLVAKKALDQRGGASSGSSADGEDDGADSEGGGGGASRATDSLRTVGDMLTWDRAQEMLLPMAERAASAVGTYVARETPDIVSERLVPRFIDAFNKARSQD
jgi:hypothetical protein